MAFAREIVEEPDAQRVIDNEIRDNPRLSDFWEGFKWFLARGPEMGVRVLNTNPQSYVIHFYHWHIAAIVATYRYSDNQVEILALRILPPT